MTQVSQGHLTRNQKHADISKSGDLHIVKTTGFLKCDVVPCFFFFEHVYKDGT